MEAESSRRMTAKDINLIYKTKVSDNQQKHGQKLNGEGEHIVLNQEILHFPSFSGIQKNTSTLGEKN